MLKGGIRERREGKEMSCNHLSSLMVVVQEDITFAYMSPCILVLRLSASCRSFLGVWGEGGGYEKMKQKKERVNLL